MTPFQINILTDIVLWCFAAFALMIPSYGLLRKSGLEIEWRGAGKVSVLGLRWFDLFGVFLLMLLLGSGVFMATASERAEVVALPNVLALLFPGFTFIIIALMAYASLAGRVHYRDFLGLVPHWGRIAVVVVLMMLLVFLLLYGLEWIGFGGWMTDHFGEREEQLAVQMLRAEGSNAQKLAMIVGVCILAPVGEEFLFRGYIYPILKKYSDPYFAAILSGVLFGVVHNHVWVVVPLSIFGIILALAYESSGSIWAPIFGHAIFNSLTVIAIFGS